MRRWTLRASQGIASLRSVPLPQWWKLSRFGLCYFNFSVASLPFASLRLRDSVPPCLLLLWLWMSYPAMALLSWNAFRNSPRSSDKRAIEYDGR